MADNLQQRGGHGPLQLLGTDAELPRPVPQLVVLVHVSPEQLKRAVAAAGTDAKQVEAWLREHKATAA